MNGYDQHSASFARAGRPTLAEAGDARSDGKSSQTREKANRYDTSTPERRRKALAAARRSANPADEAKVRKQIHEEANSTIDALMLGLHMNGTPAWRDNRATRRGGYRTQPAMEAKEESSWQHVRKEMAHGGSSGGQSSRGRTRRARQEEVDITLSVCDDEAPHGQGFEPEALGRRRTAESPLTPQRRFRDTVSWNGYEAELTTKKRNDLPDSAFAGKNRSYPIDTPERARAALARAAANASPEEISRIRSAVRRRYPDMDVE